MITELNGRLSYIIYRNYYVFTGSNQTNCKLLYLINNKSKLSQLMLSANFMLVPENSTDKITFVDYILSLAIDKPRLTYANNIMVVFNVATMSPKQSSMIDISTTPLPADGVNALPRPILIDSIENVNPEPNTVEDLNDQNSGRERSASPRSSIRVRSRSPVRIRSRSPFSRSLTSLRSSPSYHRLSRWTHGKKTQTDMSSNNITNLRTAVVRLHSKLNES